MKKLIAALLICAPLFLSSCAVIQYTDDGEVIDGKKKVFYVVNGLAPITNNKFRAGDEYTVKHDFVDWLITGLTGGIIYSRTITKK